MKSHVLAAAAIAVLVLAACQKKTDDQAPAAASTAPAANPGPAPPTARDFVMTAGAGDVFEIQAARIAEKRSRNAQVKAFAQMMIDDHTKSTEQVKAAITAAVRPDLVPPTDPSDDQARLLDALDKAPDADFDRTYADQQVSAHEDALALMKGYAMAGEVTTLKTVAANLAPTVQAHLDRITAIRSALPK